MPDESPTEEQKQVKCIFKRWRILDMAWTAAYVVFIASVSLVGVKFIATKWIRDILLVTIVFTLFSLMRAIAHITLKKVLRSLTQDERDALIRYSDANPVSLQGQIVASALSSYKVVPHQEFVRPSTEPQDETLLRAASYTADTPQDQLLRPSDPSV